jgi:hypothetical protein
MCVPAAAAAATHSQQQCVWFANIFCSPTSAIYLLRFLKLFSIFEGSAS